MSKRLGGIIGCKYKTSSWHLNGFPVVVTLGQQYNTGEKPTVMLYTYINRHAGTPDKNKNKNILSVFVFSSHSFCTSSSLDVPAGVTHRRKVTQDFLSTFFLRCVPSFFSREGFSHSFPSSTVKSNFVY